MKITYKENINRTVFKEIKAMEFFLIPTFQNPRDVFLKIIQSDGIVRLNALNMNSGEFWYCAPSDPVIPVNVELIVQMQESIEFRTMEDRKFEDEGK